ncbi:MAG: sodium:proton exchanger [Deltaproteobacteria bacterium]|nr:sodium:proton exchanger [Deltaproteobacteria bacterium]
MSRTVLKIVLAAAVTLPALFVRLAHVHLPPLAESAVFGLAVVASAFLLAWGAETAQKDISAALATALLAVIAVLPEYAVDLYFSYTSATVPEHAHFAAANMTGSNRLLIGIGWPLVAVAFVIGARRRKAEPTLVLDESRRFELAFLAAACVYAFIIPFKNSISLVDSVILIALFATYMWRASRHEHEEPELHGVAGDLAELPQTKRRLAVGALFLGAAGVILASAEPFATGLVASGKGLGLDEFLLVQWVAPLASEAPELIVAALFAFRGNADAGLGALLSSKINQWTLLVGSIPIARFAGGGGTSLPLDGRQHEEFFLTAAQALMAFAVVSDVKFRRWEAVALFLLFIIQIPMPGEHMRMIFAWVYLGVAGVMLILHRRELPKMVRALVS